MWSTRQVSTHPVYVVTDRVHHGRSARVPGQRVVTTVSEWLAELGAHSPLVDDLARAVSAGDWPAIHSIADYLCVDVAVAD